MSGTIISGQSKIYMLSKNLYSSGQGVRRQITSLINNELYSMLENDKCGTPLKKS